MTESTALERNLDASVSYVAERNRQLATIPVKPIDPSAIEQVLAYGDLTKMNSAQRTTYYVRVCESLGLNPLTRPFEFINLSGKLVFYARRDCADQLRNLHQVTVAIVSRERIDDVYVVTAKATLPSGRADESTGAVTIGNLKGDALANALMKAETKAKRRVTLSICGLSVPDETELETMRTEPRRDLPIEQQPPRISPHGDDSDEPAPPDAEAFEVLLQQLTVIEQAIPLCKDYSGSLALRDLLGSKAKQSPLTKDIQTATERGDLSPSQRQVLGKTWMRCDRQVAKLETLHKPDLSDSFRDEPEGDAAESFERT